MPDINKHSPDAFLAAFRDDPTDAPLALYAGAALDAAGRHDEALAVWTLGDDANPALRTVHKTAGAPADLKEHSRRADQAIAEHFTGLHQKTVDALAATRNADLARVRRGVWRHYATEEFKFRTRFQRPEIFYMPDLPARPVTPVDFVDWAQTLEAAADDILAEYQAAIDRDVAHEPYVPTDEEGKTWAQLRGKMDWSALYLHFNAAETPAAPHFPKTLAALSHADLVSRNGVPLETFFSRLRPGAVIPPHYGLTNTRLTVHLPLIVPDGCSIRVGDTIYLWRERKIIAFDDSFEHEAANRSDSDRVVLIFEIHHPDLSTDEREAIEAVYAAFDAWVAGRRPLLGLPEEASPAPVAAV